MVCINGGFISDEEKAVSESRSDVLLFTTMCIIGSPVDVHVKDGSIYSGTFYTACLDDNYAIVLKKARMMKKGNQEANVPDGCFIDTLIIQAEDLVQVVAKDIMLPAEGVPRKSGADDGCALAAVTSHNLCKDIEENATRPDESSTEVTEHPCINYTSLPSRPGERPAGGSPEGNQSIFAADSKSQGAQQTDEVQDSRASVDACESLPYHQENNDEEAEKDKFSNPSSEKSTGINTVDQKHGRPSLDNNQDHGALSCDVFTPASEFWPTSSSTLTNSVPPKTDKEFKLNPKAKVFSPSSVLHRAATPPALVTLANMTYVADSLSVVPVASAEPQVDTSSFAYHSSTPAKYLPHNDLVYGGGRADQQHSQPIVAYVASRTLPLRYAAQYGHLQPGTAYISPNTQNVTAERLGPLVYVHPISNDIVTYSSGGLSQVPALPILTPNPVNTSKHQAMQLYVTPPFLASGQQPLPLAVYVPTLQTLGQVLPVMGEFPVPGSDGSLVTKFV